MVTVTLVFDFLGISNYSGGLNTKQLEIRISNCSVIEWSVIAIAALWFQTFQNLTIGNGIGQNGCNFVKKGMPLESKTPLINRTEATI